MSMTDSGATARARSKPSPYAAKPSIPVKGSGGHDGSMSMKMGRACDALTKQGKGSKEQRSG